MWRSLDCALTERVQTMGSYEVTLNVNIVSATSTSEWSYSLLLSCVMTAHSYFGLTFFFDLFHFSNENAPLYLATTDLDKELELQYRVHAALDVVEEKCLPQPKATPESKELYLGLLYSTETHKIYGFVTNTKIKFIIVVDSGNIALRENEVRSMFRNLHILYTDAVCNPFYAPGESLTSRKFDKTVRNIMSGNS